ncbi:MAG: hypothetical protein FWG31_06105 [Oscillospiraceae bacterium]|nr:hypothetical protein [Oscillospiraceae bacterium]
MAKPIEEIIAFHEEKLSRLEAKQESTKTKISETKATIARFNLLKDQERLKDLTKALDAKGISFDDFIAAAVDGDFLSSLLKA